VKPPIFKARFAIGDVVEAILMRPPYSRRTWRLVTGGVEWVGVDDVDVFYGIRLNDEDVEYAHEFNVRRPKQASQGWEPKESRGGGTC
jgi:hypothetical protein